MHTWTPHLAPCSLSGAGRRANTTGASKCKATADDEDVTHRGAGGRGGAGRVRRAHPDPTPADGAVGGGCGEARSPSALSSGSLASHRRKHKSP